MLLQPDFTQNLFSLITSKKNKNFAKFLLSNGMELEKVREILIHFFSFKVPLQEIMKNAKNPEWTEHIAYMTTIHKQYDNAIKKLEKILNIRNPFSNSDIVPGIIKTPDQVNKTVSEDIEHLKKQQARFALPQNNDLLKPSIKPKPISIHQMIGFQSFALYEYLKKFNGEKNDKDIYEFIAELLQNLYKGTALDYSFKKITGDILKKNFIDNAYKVRGKYNELEKTFKPFLSKPQH